MCVCVCVHEYVCACVHVHACMRMRVCTCVCARACVHACVQSSSGHSPEGRGGSDGGHAVPADPEHSDEPFFLYGERVVSRKMRRMPRRPQSALVKGTAGQASFLSSRRANTQPPPSSEEASVVSITSARAKRPHSTPHFSVRRSWAGPGCGESAVETASGADTVSERPSSCRSSVCGERSPSPGCRTNPCHDWENDTHDVTRRILKAQRLQQLHQQQLLKHKPRSSRAYTQGLPHARLLPARRLEAFRTVSGLSPASIASIASSLALHVGARPAPVVEDPRCSWPRRRNAIRGPLSLQSS